MKTDLAYTAGLIDGEGTITLAGTKGEFRHPVVSLTSTTYGFVTFLKNRFSGSITKVKAKKKTHKIAWHWVLTGDKALQLLTDIVPFMREPKKIQRAWFLLFNYKAVTVRNGRYSTEQLRLKKKFEEDFFLI